jgi:hypothetical protein
VGRDRPRGHRRLNARTAALALACVLAGTSGASAQTSPTDIVNVDTFIDAPRALFGETGPDVLRALGPPAQHDTRRRATWRDATVTREVERLTYPGLVVEHRGRLVRVELTEPGRVLPFRLDVGASRPAVEHALGQPQLASDERVVYLYSDAFPKTVTFHFFDSRVRKIEWEYWIE